MGVLDGFLRLVGKIVWNHKKKEDFSTHKYRVLNPDCQKFGTLFSVILRMEIIKLLHIPICAFSLHTIKQKLCDFLNEPVFHLVATVNPEMLVAAHHKKYFQDILQRAELCVADGVGVVWLSRLLFGVRLSRLTGNDLFTFLLAHAMEKGKIVFLLGSSPRVLEQTLQQIKRGYPSLRVFGESGEKLFFQEGKWIFEDEISVVKHIQKAQPDILFVALGHEKQELWMDTHRDLFPFVRIAIGVGGVFDFFSGNVKRAPRLWQRCGLEWLWRLLCEPRRFKRIGTAVFIFPILVVWDTIQGLFDRKRRKKLL
jgi:N-acetylglucosaminyldiphosphoundecaprenol N-acetyl-beta-D-mannosaminyltransferase